MAASRLALGLTLAMGLALPLSAQDAAPQVGSDSPVLTAPQQVENDGAPALTGGADAAPVSPAGDISPAASAGSTDEPAGSVADSEEKVSTAESNSETVPAALPEAAPEPATGVQGALDRTMDFLITGGPSIWAIAALSVITVAVILWKIWRLIAAGAWSRRASRRAVDAWEGGDAARALASIEGRSGLRSRLVRGAMRARLSLDETAAREETARIAKSLIASQGVALRALELISTVAPLLGLLGTVMGMISAFQALQEAGSSADPSMLAGGIWEALLTTAAGMAVAIPASAALTWFEAVLENLRTDLEDLAARIFVAEIPGEGQASARITKLAAQ
ncbi:MULTISPECIES: MotA/TolQ/ExbB proton channel family protein [Pseudooceanicola]|nr:MULTISPECIES: MotA/TolQ/ExbB proton channel family protein [Pseudooceanicola]